MEAMAELAGFCLRNLADEQPNGSRDIQTRISGGSTGMTVFVQLAVTPILTSVDSEDYQPERSIIGRTVTTDTVTKQTGFYVRRPNIISG